MGNRFQKRLSAIILVVLLTGLSIGMHAQQNQTTSAEAAKIFLYKTKPVWKDMMNDPNASYFEVKKAFELFWEGKNRPPEEDEIIGEKRKLKNNFLNRAFNSKELKEQEEREALSFDCKKYKWWVIKTEPYIHDDGSIMSSEERLELWKKHYEELNNQNK